MDDTSEIIPGILDGVKEYECIRNVLRSHAKIYELYQSLYEGEARGKVGIVLDLVWREPASDSAEDIEAVDRYNQFEVSLLIARKLNTISLPVWYLRSPHIQFGRQLPSGSDRPRGQQECFGRARRIEAAAAYTRGS